MSDSAMQPAPFNSNGQIVVVDNQGRIEVLPPSFDSMLAPVRCNHCGQVYDECDGEPVARYADCTVYITPCCGRQVDDRPAGWVAFSAFTRLDRRGMPA